MEKHSRLDWIDLPATAEIIDLCLHDGELCAVNSNLIDRTLRLEFDGRHLLIDSDEDVDCPKIIFQLEGVRLAVVLVIASAGQIETPEDATFEEQKRLGCLRSASWRKESASWSEFEATLLDGDWDGPEVADAVLAVGSSESGIARSSSMYFKTG